MTNWNSGDQIARLTGEAVRSRPLQGRSGTPKALERMAKTGDIDDIDEVSVRRRGRKREKAPKVRRIEVGSTISVRELAAKLEISASECVRRAYEAGRHGSHQ